MMPRALSSCVFVAVMTARAPDIHADSPVLYDYVVKSGDDCVSIAAAQLGGWSQYVLVHRYNPQLGSLPHHLKPGTILKLPASDAAAEATLTEARGAVEVRKPAEPKWDAAHRGMDLFRSWRLGARAFSSAEVTFRDKSRLFMRENTIVIIHGATAQRTVTADAELETGALEARLAAMSKRRVLVHTASAEAALVEGDSLVTVDAAAATVVANHGGAPAAVRSIDPRRRPRGPSVKVAAGMGSKVELGKLPSKPRPLPPAPTWQAGATRFVSLGGAGATVFASWKANSVAARYHLVVRTADGQDVAAADVAAPATSVEIHRLAPGDYTATIAVADREGFESAPSSAFAFDVVGVAVFSPGASEPIPARAQTLGEARDPRAPEPPLSLAYGSHIVAGGSVTCSAGGPAATSTIVADASVTALRCDADGVSLPPVPIRVVTTNVCVGVTCSARPTQSPVVRAVSAPPNRLFELEVGGFAGYWVVPGAPSLGHVTGPDAAISNGPAWGIRGAVVWRRMFGVELEGLAAHTRYSASLGAATLVGWRAHLVGGLQHGPVGARLLVGGGTNSLVRADGPASRDTTSAFELGIAGTASIGAGWLLRLDARDSIVPGVDGRTQIVELYLGLSRSFGF